MQGERTPEQRIAHHQRRASLNVKGFILPGLALIPVGAAVKRFGVEATEIPSWVSTAYGYGVMALGAATAAWGFHERGYDQGVVAEIQLQMQATPEVPQPQIPTAQTQEKGVTT